MVHLKRSLIFLVFATCLSSFGTVYTDTTNLHGFSELPVKGMVTMIDLGAEKCIPCKMMAPIMAKLEKVYRATESADRYGNDGFIRPGTLPAYCSRRQFIGFHPPVNRKQFMANGWLMVPKDGWCSDRPLGDVFYCQSHFCHSLIRWMGSINGVRPNIKQVNLLIDCRSKSDMPYFYGRDPDFITGGKKMLLKNYRLEIFNNKCMPGAETVNCFAHL